MRSETPHQPTKERHPMMNPVTFTGSLTCPRTLLFKSETIVVASFTQPTLGPCDVRIVQAPTAADESINTSLTLTATFEFDPNREDEVTRNAAWNILQSVLSTLTFRERLIFDPPIHTNRNSDLDEVRELHDFRQKMAPTQLECVAQDVGP